MLSPIQKEIVEESGNLIVRASAGTGKTHTMVSKIVYDIEYQHTHKVVAAITFTIKAANEIKERMTIDTADHFIGKKPIQLLKKSKNMLFIRGFHTK